VADGGRLLRATVEYIHHLWPDAVVSVTRSDYSDECVIRCAIPYLAVVDPPRPGLLVRDRDRLLPEFTD